MSYFAVNHFPIFIPKREIFYVLSFRRISKPVDRCPRQNMSLTDSRTIDFGRTTQRQHFSLPIIRGTETISYRVRAPLDPPLRYSISRSTFRFYKRTTFQQIIAYAFKFERRVSYPHQSAGYGKICFAHTS